MAENTTETIIGGLVLAVAVGFVVFALRGTETTGATGSYELTASFRSAQGVSVGTDVRMAGVKVGTVTSLELDPNNFRAAMRFNVREGLLLPEDSAVAIASESLLGGNYVELTPGGSFENLPAGGEIEDTQGAVGLISLLMKFVSSSEE